MLFHRNFFNFSRIPIWGIRMYIFPEPSTMRPTKRIRFSLINLTYAATNTSARRHSSSVASPGKTPTGRVPTIYWCLLVLISGRTAYFLVYSITVFQRIYKTNYALALHFKLLETQTPLTERVLLRAADLMACKIFSTTDCQN